MSRTPGLVALPGLLVALLAGCTLRPMPSDDPLRENKPRLPMRVVSVIDVNHVRLADGRTVQLHGVIPPPADHPVFAAGSAYLRDLIEGKDVIVDGDEENFYAHTWHANLFLPRSPYPLHVNGDLVRKGFVYSFTTPSNERWENWLHEQQYEARCDHVGVWRDRPDGAEYYVTDRYTNLFHRKGCPFADRLQYGWHYPHRADALEDRKVPCPDCRP